MRNIILSSLVCFSSMAAAEILTVGGSASVEIPSTKVNVQVGVQYEGASAQVIQDKVKKSGNRLLAYLKKNSVTNLSSSEYRITTRHNYNKKSKPAFSGSATYSFSVSVAKVGRIVDGALKNGANQIKNLEFTASPEAIHEAKKKAQAKAAENALDQGKATLKSLGMEYKGIKKIQLDGHRTGPRASARLAMHSSSLESSPIEGGKYQVSSTVVLDIAYKE